MTQHLTWNSRTRSTTPAQLCNIPLPWVTQVLQKISATQTLQREGHTVWLQLASLHWLLLSLTLLAMFRSFLDITPFCKLLVECCFLFIVPHSQFWYLVVCVVATWISVVDDGFHRLQYDSSNSCLLRWYDKRLVGISYIFSPGATSRLSTSKWMEFTVKRWNSMGPYWEA